MKVSVVVAEHTLDMYGEFQDAVESVFAQTHDDVELVVVVDGPEDVYERAMADYGDRDDVVVHLNDENQGLLVSRNNGAKAATGDVVAFLDDDAVADERWVEELVATYEAHGALAAGGRMVPEWVAGEPAFIPEEFYFLIGATYRGFGDGVDTPAEVRNTNGSNISFRRDVFLDLDGFDPTIGGRKGDRNLQGGETELCERLRVEYGDGVRYNPDAVVAHKIYDYRTELRWLLDRAFWQGYSKRGMETLAPDSGDEESEFLRQLAFEFVPRRLRSLVTEPSAAKLQQLLALVVLTPMVGLGYLYGHTKY
jgi:glycosyltransferase involved in cell wall biosynthesis